MDTDTNINIIEYLQNRIEKYEQKRKLSLINIDSSIEMIEDIIDYIKQGFSIEDSINSCIDDTLQNIFEIENKMKKIVKQDNINQYQEDLDVENSAYRELLIIRNRFNVK